MQMRHLKFKSTTRGWLIFAGIIVLVLALPMLKIRALMVMGKAGGFVALLGLALVLLGKYKRKERDTKKQ